MCIRDSCCSVAVGGGGGCSRASSNLTGLGRTSCITSGTRATGVFTGRTTAVHVLAILRLLSVALPVQKVQCAAITVVKQHQVAELTAGRLASPHILNFTHILKRGAGKLKVNGRGRSGGRSIGIHTCHERRTSGAFALRWSLRQRSRVDETAQCRRNFAEHRLKAVVECPLLDDCAASEEKL
eukprot:1729900-Pleurochrysis_carterae.AAC.2